MTKKSLDVTKITYIALFTAIVFVLQNVGGFIRFGMFSVSLVLVPIVIGAALCGKWAGAWLGFVFSIAVFVTGDAAFFLSLNIPGTIVTVILKGTLAGLAAGIAYDLVKKINRFAAVMTAAVVCPIVNTGIFLIGSRLFFFDVVKEWAIGEGVSAGVYMIVFLVGFNFVFELLFNVVLAPVAVRLLDMKNPAKK
ncbi:MAG: ECF transporter S component [Ruminococcaceae bacterium]|nr:ECF transporter S component [Oscillospiraceae bacterium]